MSDYLGDLGRYVRRSANSRVDEAFGDGFNEAARIAMSAISKKIDDLTGQIGQGRLLTDHEQLLLAALTRLRPDMEAEFFDFWREANSDGRS